MQYQQPCVPARFMPGTLLEGRLSSAIVLEVDEGSSLAILLLLPSGYRVITKFWQIEAWNLSPPQTEGWQIDRFIGSTKDADWSVHLPDIDCIAAILNDHNWHGSEPAYRYRVVPPDNASDEEMAHIENLGGFL